MCLCVRVQDKRHAWVWCELSADMMLLRVQLPCGVHHKKADAVSTVQASCIGCHSSIGKDVLHCTDQVGKCVPCYDRLAGTETGRQTCNYSHYMHKQNGDLCRTTETMTGVQKTQKMS